MSSATLSQLVFVGEKRPEFPMGKKIKIPIGTIIMFIKRYNDFSDDPSTQTSQSLFEDAQSVTNADLMIKLCSNGKIIATNDQFMEKLAVIVEELRGDVLCLWKPPRWPCG